jgi:hypothetical protein
MRAVERRFLPVARESKLLIRLVEERDDIWCLDDLQRERQHRDGRHAGWKAILGSAGVALGALGNAKALRTPRGPNITHQPHVAIRGVHAG